MEDFDPTHPVPKPATAPQGSVTDSQMRNLQAVGQGAFATRSRTPAGSWQPPSVEALQWELPQYEITAFIARGGMGAVYQATQRALKRAVAIKVLPPDIDDGDMQFTERFKHEAQAMARLSHPNIVAVHDAGETTDGLLYFVMEFIEGTDVARLITSEGKIAPAQAVPIITAVCEALAFAHEEGIIHRDIKPSNIMLDRKGRVKVADFGLAKAVNVESTLITRTDVAMGTPDFIAPEALISGMKVDGRADIYAVGVMLYQMLTGQVPRGRFDPPSELVSQVDPRFDDIVDKAMQTDRERRYTTATEMKKDVEAATAPVAVAVPTKAGSGGSRVEAARPPRRIWRRPVLVLGLAAPVVAAVWLGWAGFERTEERSVPAGNAPQAQKHATLVSEEPPAAALSNKNGWQPLFSKAEELEPLFRSPAGLVSMPEHKEAILKNPQRALRIQNGWLEPGFPEVKVTLPPHSQVGLRLHVKSMPGKSMDTVKMFRTPKSSKERFAANCREITLYTGGREQTGPQRLTERRTPPAVPPGERYMLEFYAIGPHLICRQGGQTLRIQDARLIGAASYLTLAAPVSQMEWIKLDGLGEAEAMKAAGMQTDGAASESKSGKWQKFYTRAEDLIPLYKKPSSLYIFFKDHPELMQTPQSGLRFEDGWLIPMTDVKLPLPDARNAGVRIRVLKGAGGMDVAALCLRSSATGGEYQAGWRGITQYHGRGGQQPTKLIYRNDPTPASQGEEFTLEFYVIGSRLVSRYNKDMVTVVNGDFEQAYAHLNFRVPVTDIEFINLDSLSETEALKVAGVSAADFPQ